MSHYHPQETPESWAQLAVRSNKWGEAWYDWGCRVREDIKALECMVCYIEKFLEGKYNDFKPDDDECPSICKRRDKSEAALGKEEKGEKADWNWEGGDPGEPPKKPWG